MKDHKFEAAKTRHCFEGIRGDISQPSLANNSPWSNISATGSFEITRGSPVSGSVSDSGIAIDEAVIGNGTGYNLDSSERRPFLSTRQHVISPLGL
ncbi:MAG: hypothetical protein LBO73_03410 [Holosporaceae bacterium]|nr:hypothetical protein [Holosporaceae bacterium]